MGCIWLPLPFHKVHRILVQTRQRSQQIQDPIVHEKKEHFLEFPAIRGPLGIPCRFASSSEPHVASLTRRLG
jgi:hypothetical protein